MLFRSRDAFEWSRCTAQPELRTTGMRLVFVGVLVVVGGSCMWYVVLLWWFGSVRLVVGFVWLKGDQNGP